MAENKNIRRAALDILMRMEKENGEGYSNRLIDSAISKHGFEGADRALLSQIVSGVTERRITLDYIIGKFSKSPLSKLDADALCLLRMGLYQLRYLDRIPSHAAVNETVNLARSRSRGFINAILRSYLRTDSIKFPEKPDDLRLSVTYSAPRELCAKFISLFGVEESEKILSSYLETPALTLRVNTLKTTREELISKLEAEGFECIPTETSPYGIRVTGSGLPSAITEGLAYVQDEASQISSLVLDPKAGDKLLDACACPGGKSFSAAMLMGGEGSITSRDLHASKLPLISSGAERLGISIIRTEERDSSIPSDEKYTKIICDVPCSGLGVAAKKTEIKYRPLEKNAELPALQYSILCAVAQSLEIGGTLVYSTCTILPEENGDIVDRFLAEHPDFEAVPFAVGKHNAPEARLTLLPCGAHDGFFISKITRKSN
ncbi:MAG: 16S rRNA (cytosine(967)-C(5))-methyltransferase RsmB [Clostridia bacterium]|nr:16S rRNA (cytosine(967)-C(5))-methyltransferase RsmB [Clostridia bacterium]